MIVITLSVVCIILVLVLIFTLLKMKPLYEDLQKYRQTLSVSAGDQNALKPHIDEKLSSGLKTVGDKSDQLKNDPLVIELTDKLRSRASFLSLLFIKVLESSQIILGISTGLFGMSVVAVIFHFMKYVGNHHTSEFLESVSYSVFFLFVTMGIVSNNYLQRKIKREQDNLLKAEISFQEKLQNLKASYEDILDKSQKEQNSAILAKAKIVSELSHLANQRQQKIALLERHSKNDKFLLKLGKLFRKKSNPSAELRNE